VILAGLPHEVDKQAAKLLNIDWKGVGHLKLVEETFLEEAKKEKKEEAIPNVAS
jgi:hypothetical protein